jgi:hypothetical protein
MGDLVHGLWKTAEERASMRALDAEIVRLTRVVEALREAYACERANRSRRRGEVVAFSAGSTTNA